NRVQLLDMGDFVNQTYVLCLYR
ncbi:hypothetical protein VCHENC02_2608B, partial [Vibrio harveyi]